MAEAPVARSHLAGQGLRLVGSFLTLAVLAATAALAPRSAAACSGPLVTVAEAVDEASAIVLVRTAAVRGDPESPDGYAFEVEEAFLGRVPARLEIEAPPWYVCGDRIYAATGDRLVIAFDVEAFAGQPPLSPYWRVLADGTLSPDGIDASAVPWTTLEDLRAGLADLDGAIIGDEEPATDQGLPAWAIAGGLLLAIVSLFLLATALAGRRR